MKIYNLLIALTFAFCSCGDLQDKEKIPNCLVDNEELFIQLSEKILFNRFGKNQIEKQKPYIVKVRQDTIWTIKGQLPENTDGGVFYLEMNCKNAQILKIKHGK